MDGLVIKMNTSGFEVLNLVNKNKQTKKKSLTGKFSNLHQLHLQMKPPSSINLLNYQLLLNIEKFDMGPAAAIHC